MKCSAEVRRFHLNVLTKGFCPQTQNASYYNALSSPEKCPPSERVKGVCRTAGTNCECSFYVLLKKESVRYS